MEEFHIGFRYQYVTDPRIPEYSETVEIENHDDLKYPVREKTDREDFRVKLLDRSDIEELGWEVEKYNGFFFKKDYHLDMEDGVVTISKDMGWHYNGGKEWRILFRGQIKNYNELKTIMTQIGII